MEEASSIQEASDGQVDVVDTFHPLFRIGQARME
jgi:hypothetical protein